jgi:hypothetical protein
MAKHSGKVNAMHLDRLWKAIPEQLAKSQDATAKKFTFKDVVVDLNRYDRLVGAIDWLQAAGLIIKVHIASKRFLPLSAYTKENCFKLFLFDVGMLGPLSGITPNMILAYDYGSYTAHLTQKLLCSRESETKKQLVS